MPITNNINNLRVELIPLWRRVFSTKLSVSSPSKDRGNMVGILGFSVVDRGFESPGQVRSLRAKIDWLGESGWYFREWETCPLADLFQWTNTINYNYVCFSGTKQTSSRIENCKVQHQIGLSNFVLQLSGLHNLYKKNIPHIYNDFIYLI